MGHYDNDFLGETPYRFALDIYDLFSYNGQSYDGYLWLQDTQLLGDCLNKNELYNHNLPANLSPKDWTYFLSFAKPKKGSLPLKNLSDSQNLLILKNLPQLKDAIDDLFDKNPYIVDQGKQRIINHEQALNFVEFMVNVKDGIYPLVIEERKEKGDKADKAFLRDALKLFKAEELFARSAILVSSVCHIFKNDEKDKKRWVDIFHRNNKFYFNDSVEKYDDVYRSLKVLVDKYINENVLDRETLATSFKSLVLIRRNSYEKYKKLSLRIFLDYVD